MKRSYKLQKRWVRVDFFLLSFIKKLIIGKTILFFCARVAGGFVCALEGCAAEPQRRTTKPLKTPLIFTLHRPSLRPALKVSLARQARYNKSETKMIFVA